MDHAAFMAFFAGSFQRALDHVEIPGMGVTSWDRKAAWLLWMATDEGRRPLPVVSDLPAATPQHPTEVDLFS